MSLDALSLAPASAIPGGVDSLDAVLITFLARFEKEALNYTMQVHYLHFGLHLCPFCVYAW